MTKNTGKEYEELTEEVFRRLLHQEHLVANVERDAKVVGRSTTHQIDVQFTFRAGGVQYRTIVQCKDWASASVKQEQVLAFHSVLQDIPGQPRGIMVARSGFQEGARRVAEHHGIELYELREPRLEDWEGLIREIHITVSLMDPHFRGVRVRPDQDWFSRELVRLGVPATGETRSFNAAQSKFYDAAGEAVDIQKLIQSMVPHGPCDWTPFEHVFSGPVEMDVQGFPIQRIRVLGIVGEVLVREHQQKIEIRADHMVAYCFRDVLGGNIKFLNADGERVGGEDDA